MADNSMPLGERLLGWGINQAIPIPHPSIFNGDAPSFGQGFSSSQASQIAQGNTNAAANWGAGLLGSAAGQALIPIPVIGGMIGGVAGRWIQSHLFGDNSPTASAYGPYASGYQYPDQSQSQDTNSYVPDFSNYGNTLTGGGDSGVSFNAAEAGPGAGWSGNSLPGGGSWNVMNGASPGMMADFAAPMGGDWMARLQSHIGQQGPNQTAKAE